MSPCVCPIRNKSMFYKYIGPLARIVAPFQLASKNIHVLIGWRKSHIIPLSPYTMLPHASTGSIQDITSSKNTKNFFFIICQGRRTNLLHKATVCANYLSLHKQGLENKTIKYAYLMALLNIVYTFI
ncbi:hypothetical protein ACJX0J_025209 [Zea mays]